MSSDRSGGERERERLSSVASSLAMVVLTDLPAEGSGASLSQSHSSPASAPAEDVIKYSESQLKPIKMEISTGVFDTRHPDNTEVLLALLTQNKELEGKA